MSDENESVTEVTSTSWFSRLGGAFSGIGAGLVLIVIATGLMYWNEGRAVRTGDAIAEAQLVTVSMPSVAKVDPGFDGKTVYATGLATTKDVLTDPLFGVKAPAIQLVRKVEYFQWTEHTQTEKRKKMGGGEETVTTYTYSKEWTTEPVDATQFKRPQGHENMTRVQAKPESWYAQNVTFGAYRLPAFLIHSMGGAKGLELNLDENARAELQKALFPPERANSLGEYAGAQIGLAFDPASLVHTQGSMLYIGRNPDLANIGDVRVGFQVVLPADVSLIAKVRGDTFVPFHASNGNDFYELSMGTRDMNAMFDDAKSSNQFMTWALRIVGVLLCIAGFRALVAPVAVLADVIPLLGSIVGAGTNLVATLVGLAWSCVDIAIAWIRFRPLLGGCLLGAAAVLLIILFVKGRGRKPVKAV